MFVMILVKSLMFHKIQNFQTETHGSPNVLIIYYSWWQKCWIKFDGNNNGGLHINVAIACHKLLGTSHEAVMGVLTLYFT